MPSHRQRGIQLKNSKARTEEEGKETFKDQCWLISVLKHSNAKDGCFHLGKDASLYSHVELSQQLVDRQQAGNILDNNFPSGFDGSVVGICPFSFAFPPPWFLQNKWQRVTGEEDSRLLGPGNKALGSGIMQAAPKPAFQKALCYPGKHPWHAQENKHLHL